MAQGGACVVGNKPSAATVDLTGVHVLIVEDDEDSRQLLATFLEYCGALVTMCHSTESALEDLAEYRPHVIVSDLSLPGADGLHFIRALRRLEPEAGGDVPAIAVSGYDKDFTAAAAKIAGYSGYLVKPVNLDDLVTLVRDLVNP
ncbi:MAG: response regulator [Candidatus Rokuibacteriota bacterium]|nr:MAG: response regulator [Candidatus Rokubacteria bacterium]